MTNKKAGTLAPKLRKTAAQVRPILVVDGDGLVALVTDLLTDDSFWVEWSPSKTCWTCSGCRTPRSGEACIHVRAYTLRLPLDVALKIAATLRGKSRGKSAASAEEPDEPPAEVVAANLERARQRAEKKAAVLAARQAERAEEDRRRAERQSTWTRAVDIASPRPKRKRVVGPFGEIDTRDTESSRHRTTS